VLIAAASCCEFLSEVESMSQVRASAPRPAAPVDTAPHLYERLAERVAALIGAGTLRPGDRAPSVRQLSRQQGVSVATVLSAYSLLENRGLLVARPQSGYYVAAQRPARSAVLPPLPGDPPCPPGSACAVSVDELLRRVQNDVASPRLVPLGAAVPSPELLPSAKLTRLMLQAAREQPQRSTAYDSPRGTRELRVQIAQRLLAAGCELAPDDILITNGCSEAVFLALRAACRPGGLVAIETPCQYGLLLALEVLGLRALEIPTCPIAGMSLPALRLALEQQPVEAVLLTTNFSNPLGSSLPDAAKRELAELAAQHKVAVIEDDIYGDMAFSGERPRVAKAWDRSGRVLLCGSFSKTLAPGYRVGWCASGQYAREVERVKRATSFASPTLPQLAIARFLESGGYDHHLRRLRRVYAEQVERAAAAIARHFPAGTQVSQPGGGYLLWVELPERVDSLALYQRALEAQVSVVPGPLFSPQGKYRNCIRVSCGAPWSPRVEGALATLGALAQALAG
jgi:DNA-binding transcriptional MocR family regulator